MCQLLHIKSLKGFVTPPTKLGPKIQGFAGGSTASLIGTVEWHIQCDNGLVHTITLPYASYVPQAELWMLLPQHWAQATNDLRCTLCITYGDCFLLKWDNQKYQKTIPISPNKTKNVGIMMSARGNHRHLNLCATFQNKLPTIAFNSTIDFDTTEATVSSSLLLGDCSTHIAKSTLTPTHSQSTFVTNWIRHYLIHI